MRYSRTVGLLMGVLVLALVVTGCAGGKVVEAESGTRMAPLADMPQPVQDAPATVRESYQYAVANADVLKQIPCYCGCGAMGHTSNYSCYVQEGASREDAIVFDGHALGCSICVDITQDTMRLSGEGRTVEQILAYVDQRYSRFGPPTP